MRNDIYIYIYIYFKFNDIKFYKFNVNFINSMMNLKMKYIRNVFMSFLFILFFISKKISPTSVFNALVHIYIYIYDIVQKYGLVT
jgi:hypothetical protein